MAHIPQLWSGIRERCAELGAAVAPPNPSGVATFAPGVAAGVVAQATGLQLSGLLLKACRLSGSTFLGRTFLLCAVPASGVASTWAAIAVATGDPECRRFRKLINTASGLTDREAAAGIGGFSLAAFYACGGRLARLGPSSLFTVGPFGQPRSALPASKGEYATVAQKRALEALGRRCGCHHCGVRRGLSGRVVWIGDHMPPSGFVRTATDMTWAERLRGRLWAALRRSKGPLQSHEQKLYPQCQRCSFLQAPAVKSRKTALVLPRTLRLYHLWTPLPLVATVLSTTFFASSASKLRS